VRLHRQLALAALVVVVAPAMVVTGGLEPTLARFTASSSPGASLTTATLDPPTRLAARGGASVVLTWVATSDPFVTGYELWRATVSGGPYTLAAGLAGRSTVTASDAPPLSGPYYYVVRSVYMGWTSRDSNQVAVTVTRAPISTSFRGCRAGSNAAESGGDGNGYETNPGNACADDAASAIDANSGTNTATSCTSPGKDRHRFWDFGLGVPSTVRAVSGIQVRADVGLSVAGGTTLVCAQLSWNGGLSWTAARSVSLAGGVAITTYTLGATTFDWGRRWAGADFSDANFRVRIIDVSNQATKTFLLEYLAVQVTYSP